MSKYTELLRAEFLRLLTEDGPTNDRRRKGYNQAIFIPEDEVGLGGAAVWDRTTLDMVMDKFDRAVRQV